MPRRPSWNRRGKPGPPPPPPPPPPPSASLQESEVVTTDEAESDLIAVLEERRNQAVQEHHHHSVADTEDPRSYQPPSASSYSSFDSYTGGAVAGERPPFGEHIRGDSLGQIWDLFSSDMSRISSPEGRTPPNPRSKPAASSLPPSSPLKLFGDEGRSSSGGSSTPKRESSQRSPAHRRRHHQRNISEPPTAAARARTPPMPPSANGRPSLQQYRSLSQKGFSNSRAVAQRALHKRGAGHRRLASLLTSIDEDALIGIHTEEGGSPQSQKRHPVSHASRQRLGSYGSGSFGSVSSGNHGNNNRPRSHSHHETSSSSFEQEQQQQQQPPYIHNVSRSKRNVFDWGPSTDDNNTDKLIDNAMRLEDLFSPSSNKDEGLRRRRSISSSNLSQDDSRDDNVMEYSTDEGDDENNDLFHNRPETTPLLGTGIDGDDGENNDNNNGGGGRSNIRQSTFNFSGFRPRSLSARRHKRWMKKLLFFINPISYLILLWQMMRNSLAVFVGLPAAVVAWILFYYLQNPELEFLPGAATVSWWFNFGCRQMCTLDLARLTQHLYISLSLNTSFSVKFFGPYFTLLSIQAKGVPILLILWSLWNLLLLHGTQPFQLHWLYRSGLAIYTRANSGVYILNSDEYLRVLLAMIVSGLALGVKRTVVALYFGRRTITLFKPKLEKLLSDIVLVAEVSELAEEANKAVESMVFAGASTNDIGRGNLRVTTSEDIDLMSVRSLTNSKWQGVKFHDTTKTPLKTPLVKTPGGFVVGGAVGGDSLEEESDESSDGGNDDHDADHDIGQGILEMDYASVSDIPPQRPTHKRSVSKLEQMSNLLDRWQEPVNKLDRASVEASISDILKFRKALGHMDGLCPFGEAYGPAWTREECIESAYSVYNHLLKLAPDDEGNGDSGEDYSTISFDVLRLLATDDDGMEIKEKLKAYKRLFRPNQANEITVLAFVQSCDAVYRRLRYFRASVGNASLIDKVLEDILNNLFAFVLGLVVLGILNFNPWPLLASTSAMLVSVSFAFGPSAAKYFDGMLLILARRPYDLGDRIIISNPGTVADLYDARRDSWFVEDINLFTTTLRRSSDSTVATINNSSIAQLKIVNCQRSPNAVVPLDLKFNIAMHVEGKIDKFQAAVEEYLQSNPRTWDSLKFLILIDLNKDCEYATYQMSVVHRLGWQDAVKIAKSRAQLVAFCSKTANELGVNYWEPFPKRTVFYGGNRKLVQDPQYNPPPSALDPDTDATDTATRTSDAMESFLQDVALAGK